MGKEIATALRGRTISLEIFPLSFSEYLNFKNVKGEIRASGEKAKVISMFGK